MEDDSQNVAIDESANDSTLEETNHNNQSTLKEILESFTKFKKWYEQRTECTKEEAQKLQRMQYVVESCLYYDITNGNI